MTPGPGIEAALDWWEARALTTGRSLLSLILLVAKLGLNRFEVNSSYVALSSIVSISSVDLSLSQSNLN